MRRYAIPLDESTVVIRSSPPTHLEVLTTEDADTVQLVLVQASTLPPLTAAEADAIHPFFHWERREHFWWRTLYPAVLRTESVEPGLEAGYLVERGEIVRVPGVPRVRPSGHDLIFGLRPSPRAEYVPLREPWGPELVRDTAGRPVQEYRARALGAYQARFPGFGPEPVWLWLLRGRTATRPAHRGALRSAARALAALGRLRPPSAAEVLHHGTLEVENYTGPYAAVRPVVGLGLESLRAGGGVLWPSDPAVLLGEITRDLLRTLGAAHGADPPFGVGMLSPDLLRFRPSRHRGRPEMTVVLLLAPGAGPFGENVSRSLLDLLPDGGAAYLQAQFEAPYVRTAGQDLIGLGWCLEEMLRRCGPESGRLWELAASLKASRFADADAALQAL